MPSLSDVKVTISTDANLDGINKVNESLGKLSDDTEHKVSGLSAKTAAIAGAVAGAVQSLAMDGISMITSTVGDAVRRVDTLNNSSKVFQNLGFDTKQVDTAMGELKNSILGLPTSLDQAVSGMESLALQNGNVEDARKEFTAMNDAVLSTGGSSAQLENAIQQITQLDMNGPLDAQTWNSLKQSGLEPAMSAMAKMSGVSMATLKDEFGNGKLKVSDFMDKLKTLDTQGTGNMASLSKQAKDMTGGIGTGFTNMKTAMTRGMADIIQAIGSKNISDAFANIGKGFESVEKSVGQFITSPSFKEFMSDFKDVIINAVKLLRKEWDNLKPSIDALSKTFNEKLLPPLEEFWKKHGPQIEQILKDVSIAFGTTLYAAIWLVVNTINLFLKGLGWIIKAIDDGNPIILGLAGVFGTLAASMAFNAIFDALTVGFATLRLVTIPSVMASIGALQGMILAPLVMPAIAVGAAIASIVLVIKAANDAADAVNNAKIAAENLDVSQSAAKRKLLDLQRNGNAAQKQRATAALNSGIYNGFASGGFTGVGAPDEVAGVVHKGEYVLPQKAVDQRTGQPKISTSHSTYNIQSVVLSTAEATAEFFKLQDRNGQLVSMGLSPARTY